MAINIKGVSGLAVGNLNFKGKVIFRSGIVKNPTDPTDPTDPPDQPSDEFYILAENGDNLATENGDFLIIEM